MTNIRSTQKRVEGSALVPNLSEHQVGIAKRHTYWVGILPKTPVESMAVAGVSFPKMNERIIPDPTNPGGKRRIPVIGALVDLTRDKLDLLAERIPNTVIRFLEEAPVKEEPGTGVNLGDLHQRARRGHLITIPSAEDVETRKARGKATQQYIPREGDQPAARYMFAVLCKDQNKPERGEFYPDVLETTGLVWPEDVSDERDTDRSGDPDPVEQRGSDSGADSLLC